MRKISRKGLVKKLDKLVSDLVIARDMVCVCCGRKSQLTAGHLFSRTAYNTRWSLDNVYAQCWPCNYKQKVTGDSLPLLRYAELILGKDAVDELHRKYHTPVKFKDFQLMELYEKLSKEI